MGEEEGKGKSIRSFIILDKIDFINKLINILAQSFLTLTFIRTDICEVTILWGSQPLLRVELANNMLCEQVLPMIDLKKSGEPS